MQRIAEEIWRAHFTTLVILIVSFFFEKETAIWRLMCLIKQNECSEHSFLKKKNEWEF